MNIIKANNYEDLSKKTAVLIAGQVLSNPTSVLGLATGSTPVGTYEALIKLYEEGVVDFSQVTSFNLDEYYGLDKTHHQSYYYFMMKHLFDKINISKDAIHIPNGIAKNVEEECMEYDRAIALAGGVDLQILGIGLNGHIGFNEPNEYFAEDTHLVDLSQDTIEANARFFDHIEEVPRQALSMGIKSIMRAKSIILLGAGKEKQAIIQKAMFEPVTPSVPASILQYHKNLTVIISD